MTSNKDLEEKIEKLSYKLEEHKGDYSHNFIEGEHGPAIRFVLLCITIISAVFMIWFFIYYISNPQYTTASPCELGLMEWEEECTAYLPVIEDCSRYNICMVGMIDKCKQDYEDCIKHPKFMCSESTKSCPYFGPGIMVVKE